MADCAEVCKSREFAKVFDNNDLTNWLVCDILNCTKLIVHASGSGGYDECIKYLSPQLCQFALIKVIGINRNLTPIDRTSRYVLISWIGSEAPIICRAKTSGISTSVRQCFANVHVHLQVNSLSLMSKERIIRELNRACGEKSSYDYLFTNEENLNHSDVDFEKDATLDQLWEVFRQQESSINWILFQLDKDDSITTFGYGMNGMKEMINNLDERKVLYGIFKVIAFSQAGARISIREKFVFLCWVPEEAPVFSRAQAVTRKQVVLKRLETYHVEIRAEQKEDISRETVVSILDNSCGSHKPQKYIFGPGDEMAC